MPLMHGVWTSAKLAKKGDIAMRINEISCEIIVNHALLLFFFLAHNWSNWGYGGSKWLWWLMQLLEPNWKKKLNPQEKHFPPSTPIVLFEKKSKPIELLGIEFARTYCCQSDRMLPSAHWIKANGYTLDLHYGRVTLIDLPPNLTVSSSHMDDLLGSFLNNGDSLCSNTLQIIADPSPIHLALLTCHYST
jgi:hypothetical protein